MKMLKQVLFACVILLTAGSLASCNTMAGMGQDVQHVGKTVTKAAQH